MRRSSAMSGAVACTAFLLSFLGGCTKTAVFTEDTIAKAREQTAVPSSEQKRPAQGDLTRSVAAGERQAAEGGSSERQKPVPRVEGRTEGMEHMPSGEAPLHFSPIYFDFDKYILKPEARSILKSHADRLASLTSYRVIVEGHCDERGSAEYNLALGQRRADEARNFLVELGMDGRRIQTVSYGYERPADPGHTEEAWAKNRRAEFLLMRDMQPAAR